MFSAFLHDHTRLHAAAGPGKEGVAAQHSCPSQHFSLPMVSKFGLV